MEKFLFIGGAKASGKSVIRGLLDGHPQLFVSIFHEQIFQSLYENDSNLLKKKDIQQIRNLLASKGDYYQLERLTKRAFYYTVAGADHRRIDTKNFDHYTTEEIITKCCEQLGITTSNNTVYNQSKLLLNNLNQRDRDLIAEALDLNESSNTLS